MVCPDLESISAPLPMTCDWISKGEGTVDWEPIVLPGDPSKPMPLSSEFFNTGLGTLGRLPPELRRMIFERIFSGGGAYAVQLDRRLLDLKRTSRAFFNESAPVETRKCPFVVEANGDWTFVKVMNDDQFQIFPKAYEGDERLLSFLWHKFSHVCLRVIAPTHKSLASLIRFRNSLKPFVEFFLLGPYRRQETLPDFVIEVIESHGQTWLEKPTDEYPFVKLSTTCGLAFDRNGQPRQTTDTPQVDGVLAELSDLEIAIAPLLSLWTCNRMILKLPDTIKEILDVGLTNQTAECHYTMSEGVEGQRLRSRPLFTNILNPARGQPLCHSAWGNLRSFLDPYNDPIWTQSHGKLFADRNRGPFPTSLVPWLSPAMMQLQNNRRNSGYWDTALQFELDRILDCSRASDAAKMRLQRFIDVDMMINSYIDPPGLGFPRTGFQVVERSRVIGEISRHCSKQLNELEAAFSANEWVTPTPQRLRESIKRRWQAFEWLKIRLSMYPFSYKETRWADIEGVPPILS